MAEKILSFEEYYNKAQAAKVEEIEDTEETPKETEEIEDEEIEDESEEEDADDVESEEDEDEDEEESEEDEDEEDSEELEKEVSEMLKETYEKVITEACAYEKDDYPEHTIEEYLKENASLCATLGADALEKCHAEVREGEMTKEIFEAACNEMKEAFVKKIDELKEAWSAQ